MSITGLLPRLGGAGIVLPAAEMAAFFVMLPHSRTGNKRN